MIDLDWSDEEAEEVLKMAMFHFESVRAAYRCGDLEIIMRTLEGLSCRDCEDRKIGVCPGEGLNGFDCLMCMYDKTLHCEGGLIGTPPFTENGDRPQGEESGK